jgi:IS5 family transposase
MERKSAEPTFTDGLTCDLGGPRTTAFFKVCQTQIPWAKLAEPLKGLYQKDPNVGRGGRPHWPVEMMVKIMLMQRWFGLSDPMMEEMLKDRISFRKFVGLSFDDATPDETTICVFRGRLREGNLDRALFDQSLAILGEHGLVLKEGTLVDATIIESPRGTDREDGTKTTDKCASWAVKRGQMHFGYKASIATDKRGMIKEVVYDTAKVSDHRHADQLMDLEPSGGEVYADAGYRKKERSQGLEARGVRAFISHQRVPGQKELTPDQKAHNRVVAGVRGLVEMPFAWIKGCGGGQTRYRGLRRNCLDFVLHAVAYNWRRSFSLACVLN